MITFKKIDIKSIFEWAMVLYIAFYMIIYGVGKYYQFGNFEQYNQPLNSYKGMDLMWGFYAYNKTYCFIIGAFEIIGALLLVIPKSRIVGCILLTSILTNIILQDYFYGVNIGALLYAVIFQVMILIILFFNRKQIINGLQQFHINVSGFSPLKNLTNIVLIITLVAFFFVGFRFLIN